MNDYITVLLNDLEDRAAEFLPGDYYRAVNLETAAAEALEATLSREQEALFEVFTARQSDSAARYQEALARQAFLLGREIGR